VLTTAAKGIAEIITVAGYINVDFEDVKTVMKNSGVAIMGTGVASGPNRAQLAVEEALNSPLLDNNDINGAGNLLLYISSGKEEITMDEVTEITDYIQEKTKSNGDVIWGNGFDESLDDKISVTIIATGFDEDHKQKDPYKPVDVKVHPLYPGSEAPKIERRILQNEPEMPVPLYQKEEIDAPLLRTETPVFETETLSESTETVRPIEFIIEKPEPDTKQETSKILVEEPQLVDKADMAIPEMTLRPQTDVPPSQPSAPDPDDLQNKKSIERISKLRQLSEKLKSHTPIESNLYELESIPAYKRRNVPLSDVTPSNESQVAKYMLSENPDKSVELKNENSFLHKNVD